MIFRMSMGNDSLVITGPMPDNFGYYLKKDYNTDNDVFSMYSPSLQIENTGDSFGNTVTESKKSFPFWLIAAGILILNR